MRSFLTQKTAIICFGPVIPESVVTGSQIKTFKCKPYHKALRYLVAGGDPHVTDQFISSSPSFFSIITIMLKKKLIRLIAPKE